MRTLRQLVAGTDFSACAEQALELAITLARAVTPPARIALVHVCELGEDEGDERRLARRGAALERAVVRHQHRGVAITGVLRSGQPAAKLENVAVDVGATLIIVGRHGRRCGPHFALGSVAARLVQSASRPVLTVPCRFTRLEVEASESNR